MKEKRPLVRVTSWERGNYTSMSAYCYMHGCKCAAPASRIPSHKKIMEWALLGTQLGEGNHHREAHSAEWRKILPA